MAQTVVISKSESGNLMKLNNSFVLLIVAAAILAGGCITSTPYQPENTPHQPGDGHFGYGATQVAPDTFRVNFRGNKLNSLTQVQDFCSLLAAEVTLQKGFAFYVELERKDQVGTQFSFPLSDLLIKCLKSKPDGGNVMDAAFVQQSIREKYKLAK